MSEKREFRAHRSASPQCISKLLCEDNSKSQSHLLKRPSDVALYSKKKPAGFLKLLSYTSLNYISCLLPAYSPCSPMALELKLLETRLIAQLGFLKLLRQWEYCNLLENTLR